MNHHTSGTLAAVGAFTLWGVLPLYWKLTGFMPSASIVAHRTLWSLLILSGILLAKRDLRALLSQLRTAADIGWLLLSGMLLAANWILYVWATLNDRIIEGALGYYLNPFFNMLFGMWWFGERHNRRQVFAIALALCGAMMQIPAIDGFPWVALTLASTFSLYAVVKKRSNLGSRLGLTAESALLAPIALGWLIFQHPTVGSAFGGIWTHALLLIGTGIATTAPLLMFGYAARAIRLTSLGMIQFIGPTLQLLIGWQLFNEPMTPLRILSFALIWAAIAVYTADAVRRRHL